MPTQHNPSRPTKFLPAVIIALLLAAQGAMAAPTAKVRLTPTEISARTAHDAGAGTSGISAIRTTVLSGDPTRAGLYTIRLIVPAGTKIAAHTHRDNRTAVVVSGTWYFGYGRTASDAAKKALPPGSFHSEPAYLAHFAETRAEAAVVYITGFGPTDTKYVEVANDPRGRKSK